MEDKICHYGCGKPAKFKIGKAGNFCCSERFTLCSAYRLRASKRQQGANNSFYGQSHSEEFKTARANMYSGSKNPFYNCTHSKETKIKMSVNRVGKCKGIENPIFGRKGRLDCAEKISATRVLRKVAEGKNNPNYRHGRSINKRRDTTTEYKNWRKAVFERDNYTCQFCGKRGGDLEADHIKPVSFYPELRIDINNGRTLCPPCHKTTFKANQQERKAYYARMGIVKEVRHG